MSKKLSEIYKIIEENDIEMIDFKIVDINGTMRHVTVPSDYFNEDILSDGIGFDASNYGYAVLEKSDMVFIPDLDTAFIDPFCSSPTLSLTGDVMVIDYPSNRPYSQYPRNIVKAALRYMKELEIADTALILPEFEFYLFDEVGWKVSSDEICCHINANQAYWNSNNQGHGIVVSKQSNYHVAKPLDISYDCRCEMVKLIEASGIPVKYHHPEVGASGQFEIEPKMGEMSFMADATMIIKYIIQNTPLRHGLSATFMPKPVYGEAGSGMHVHILLLKDGEPIFSDDNGYANLSNEAMFFIGGILKHIDSLCAITNPSTNSFKRLVPGFEAPVTVGYAKSNRSAVIRIPSYAKKPNARRFEVRNPDATCNPYFAYAAILMAGLDGIKNSIDPHAEGWGPYDFNMFNLSEEEKRKMKSLPTRLEDALNALEKDNDYLTVGGVFPKELINNMITNKREECKAVSSIPHPSEFGLYYNL